MLFEKQLFPLLSEIQVVSKKNIEAIVKIKMELITAQHFEDAMAVKLIEKQTLELIESIEKLITIKH
ncbi:MAG: hypothetical protein Q7R95_07140 [bacterium]|nr:hypothetical protein [bacterium]